MCQIDNCQKYGQSTGQEFGLKSQSNVVNCLTEVADVVCNVADDDEHGPWVKTQKLFHYCQQPHLKYIYENYRQRQTQCDKCVESLSLG